MATPVAPLVIRCPACLTAHWARPDINNAVELRCSHCKQAYQLLRWIHPQGVIDGAAIAQLPVAKTRQQSASPGDTIPLLMVMIIGALSGWVLQPIIATESVDGPKFLWILAGVGLVTWMTTVALRLLWVDAWQLVVAGILLFELFGVHRILWGMEQGMTRWMYTYMMLGLGWLPFLIGLSSPGVVTQQGTWMPYNATTYGGTGSGCSSGGSSCSGGGCGGGGCGGCGGG